MHRIRRWLLSSAILIAGSVGPMSCGASNQAVVQVGQTPITRATVGHWMEVMVAGDYRYDMAKPPPAGLVSDPPNYDGCVVAAKRLSRKASESGARRLCRQLYQSVKLQAVNFLTNALWYAEDAKEHGEHVTSKQIERAYHLVQRREYSAPGQFARFLAEVHRTKADEYYLLRRNLLSNRFLERLQRQHFNLRNRDAALKLAQEWQAKWTAKTTCQPGYVASQCKQYKGPETVPAPDSILEQLARGD
jgi:hypothetical protein